jgi:hypothetical protein
MFSGLCECIFSLQQLEMRSVVRGRYATWSRFSFCWCKWPWLLCWCPGESSAFGLEAGLTFSSSAAWMDSSQIVSAVSIKVLINGCLLRVVYLSVWVWFLQIVCLIEVSVAIKSERAVKIFTFRGRKLPNIYLFSANLTLWFFFLD